MKPKELMIKCDEGIRESLKKGKIPRRGKHNALQISGTTGKPYGVGNWVNCVISKIKSDFTSNRWATFKTIQKLGGQVKKGEKATVVTYYQMLNKDEVGPDGRVTPKRIPLLRHYHVFNLDQTSLGSVTDREMLKVVTAEQIVENMLEKPNIQYGSKPCYFPKLDTILIPNIEDFETPNDYYRTKFHEIGHRTGHGTRMNRDGVTGGHKFGSKEYAFEEVAIDIASSYVSTIGGIPFDADDTAGYINLEEGRLKPLKDDETAFYRATILAGKVTEYILKGKIDLMEVLNENDLQTETETV